MTLEIPGTTTPPAGAVVQPPEGTDTSPASQPPEGADDGGSGSEIMALTLEQARELRRENQALRRRLKDREDAETERKRAEMSELELLREENARLKEDRTASAEREQDRELRLAALEAAERLGFRSPAIAYRLVDRAAVEWADGKPTNVPALLERVLESEGYLARANATPDLGGGPRGDTPTAPPSMNDLLKAATGRPT